MTKYTEDILFNDTVEPAHKAYKKLKDMQKLVQSLNHYRDRYYNEDVSEISDERYDELYDELLVLENETGIVMPNSPTVTVGYEVRSELRKVEHSHLMLSLDKTKSIDDILAFFGDKSAIAMLKMDGLTCTLHYVDGNLVGAETRGNGKVGEDILHNVKTMRSVPKKIHQKGDFVVDGEIICDYKTFEKFSGEYKNPRNFAAGSARLLDSKECATRGLLFAAWDIIGGDLPFLSDKLYKLEKFKFVVAPYKYGFNKDGDRNKKATFMQVVEELRRDVTRTPEWWFAKSENAPCERSAYAYWTAWKRGMDGKGRPLADALEREMSAGGRFAANYAVALGLMKDARCVPVLRRLVAEPGCEIDPVVEKAIPNRFKAIALLGRFKDAKSVASLVEIVKDDARGFTRDIAGCRAISEACPDLLNRFVVQISQRIWNEVSWQFRL